MTITQIVEQVDGRIICGNDGPKKDIDYAFASDLMSDVLRVRADNFLLITGLANIQAIRTAEMSDAVCVILVRGKQPDKAMIELAEECGIVLILTPFSMFRASGILFAAGLKPIY